MNEIKQNWNLDELRQLYSLPIMDLINKGHAVLNRWHPKNEIQLCSLISIKTGGCPEDCKYCSQSAHYKTAVKPEPLMKVDEVVSFAKKRIAEGATRICFGAAIREVKNNHLFSQALKMVEEIKALGTEVCCCLGMLNKEQAEKLKEAGLTAYNHNLDTSETFYPKIITTRKYQDRLDTLTACEEAGLSVCCGGILGLGESIEDRLEMIRTIANRTPQPSSVPINLLVANPGTPLESSSPIDLIEWIKAIAIARIALPKSKIRLAAGREKLSEAEQLLCFMAGANSIFMGEKLLTCPNVKESKDRKMLEKMGLNRCFKP